MGDIENFRSYRFAIRDGREVLNQVRVVGPAPSGRPHANHNHPTGCVGETAGCFGKRAASRICARWPLFAIKNRRLPGAPSKPGSPAAKIPSCKNALHSWAWRIA